MTTEPMRPARIAGLALLGVAAVATVLGVVTLIGGDGDSQAGQTTPPAATTTATAPPADTTTSAQAPTTTAPPTTTTTTTTEAPATTTSEPTAKPTTPGGGAPSSQDEPVRVYNNSTVKGLADKAKADLEAAGWEVVEVGNHQGRLYETTVYFRPGTGEEAAARALGKQFDLRVEPRFDGIADASPGVIVIVTKDWSGTPNDKG
ncbi:LytR C-terminal domain-containing protein [Actinokineospora guangxiensis]|uniref:LytR C-terminal domain-containing protein n=1 Tax=Actinokineospora guangxiensis TaxID=1490288 RepID=A0ABW0EHS8_9PSEU